MALDENNGAPFTMPVQPLYGGYGYGNNGGLFGNGDLSWLILLLLCGWGGGFGMGGWGMGGMMMPWMMGGVGDGSVPPVLPFEPKAPITSSAATAIQIHLRDFFLLTAFFTRVPSDRPPISCT